MSLTYREFIVFSLLNAPCDHPKNENPINKFYQNEFEIITAYWGFLHLMHPL